MNAQKSMLSDEGKVFVQDFVVGSTYSDQVLALDEIQEHTTRTGKPYYRLTLHDKTGKAVAKVWENSFEQCPGIASLEAGDVVIATFDVQEYNNQTQLNISRLQKTDEYDLGLLSEVSTMDIDGMWERLLQIIEKIEDQHIKKLLQNIYHDDEIANKLKYVPGGLGVHHDYLGGLIEHILEIYDFAMPVVEKYQRANKDLLVAGILLHDLGKIEEIRVEKSSFIFTAKGNFYGHLVLSMEITLRYLPKDFPEEFKDQLIHIILAHNSTKEQGSPVVPSTLEAMILAKVDDLSAKVRTVDKDLAKLKPNQEGFSAYNKYISTGVFHPPADE